MVAIAAGAWLLVLIVLAWLLARERRLQREIDALDVPAYLQPRRLHPADYTPPTFHVTTNGHHEYPRSERE